MKHSIRMTFATFLVLFLYADFALGVETFGPKKYIRSHGMPDIYIDTFETKAGPGKIIVRNGEYNSKKRVPYAISSARVLLNDTQIFSPNDFGKTVCYLEADVSLNQKNTLKVELGSQAGAFLHVSIEQDNLVPLAIAITSPANGSTVEKANALVQGTWDNPSGNEVGVTVNGVLSLVEGNTFVASHVPLEEGENMITAILKDSKGNSISTSVSINSVPKEHNIWVTADRESGVLPFETTLKIEGTFSFDAPLLTYTGPGTVQILNGTKENEFNISIRTPGVYYFTSTAVFEGMTFSDTMALCVIDQMALDVLLKTKWNAMKMKLKNNDVEGALEYFAEGRSKERYREIFKFINQNSPGGIAADAQKFPEPILAKADGNRVTYILERAENDELMKYTLYFVKDNSGLWKILEY